MKTFALLLLCLIVACNQRHPAKSSYEVVGTQAERVTEISNILAKRITLPSPLLDAHFVEQKIGDDMLGPSDYFAFYVLTVATADLPVWKAALSKSETWNQYANDDEIKRAAPEKARPWWVNEADLGALEFYSPHVLTGRSNGWVGISSDGRIYVYTFTM